MTELKVATRRGTVLDGVLFGARKRARTVVIGTYDRFTDGDPVAFLENINAHLPTARENRLVFIERTGHTYQQKHGEVAVALVKLVKDWALDNDKVQ